MTAPARPDASDEAMLRKLVEVQIGCERPLTDAEWKQENDFYASLRRDQQPLAGNHPIARAERQLAALRPLIDARVAEAVQAERERCADLVAGMADAEFVELSAARRDDDLTASVTHGAAMSRLRQAADAIRARTP